MITSLWWNKVIYDSNNTTGYCRIAVPFYSSLIVDLYKTFEMRDSIYLGKHTTRVIYAQLRQYKTASNLTLHRPWTTMKESYKITGPVICNNMSSRHIISIIYAFDSKRFLAYNIHGVCGDATIWWLLVVVFIRKVETGHWIWNDTTLTQQGK